MSALLKLFPRDWLIEALFGVKPKDRTVAFVGVARIEHDFILNGTATRMLPGHTFHLVLTDPVAVQEDVQ